MRDEGSGLNTAHPVCRALCQARALELNRAAAVRAEIPLALTGFPNRNMTQRKMERGKVSGAAALSRTAWKRLISPFLPLPEPRQQIRPAAAPATSRAMLPGSGAASLLATRKPRQRWRTHYTVTRSVEAKRLDLLDEKEYSCTKYGYSSFNARLGQGAIQQESPAGPVLAARACRRGVLFAPDRSRFRRRGGRGSEGASPTCPVRHFTSDGPRQRGLLSGRS